MCGFPLVHLDRHLKTLVQQSGLFVAICEETKTSQGDFERHVARIVTPGTLIDESFLNVQQDNYVLAVGMSSETSSALGLSWIDVSTGEFYSQVSSLEDLADDLARIAPREIVLHKSLEEQQQHAVRLALAGNAPSICYVLPTDEASTRTSIPHFAPESFVFSSAHPEESQSIRLLTYFLRENMLDMMPDLAAPTFQSQESRMQIDSHTIKGLEIKESSDGGVKGTLLSVVKRTVTNGGARLLSRWLCAPSLNFHR